MKDKAFLKWVHMIQNQPSLFDKYTKKEIIDIYTKNIESFIDINFN